ncbi:hypothetical protein [Celeribacter sp. ULVN23_4]
MQISSAHHPLTGLGLSQNQSSASDQETRTASEHDKPAETETKSKSTAIKSTAIETAREIFARYDLTAISPTAIDELTAELKAVRFDDLGFVMGLERQGAAYLSEMAATGRVYGTGEEGTDPNAPVDLIARARSDLASASRYGQDTERLTTHLFKLEEAQMSRPVASAPASTSPQLAETLVLFQAQRLWIE